MSSILGAGKIVDIKCTQKLFPELPHLLFGETSDGNHYFDITNYLKYSNLKGITLEDIWSKLEFQIKSLLSYYNIPEDKSVVINSEGHQLVTMYLYLIVVGYVNGEYLAYATERMAELSTSGVAVSDPYLFDEARARLSKESLEQLNK